MALKSHGSWNLKNIFSYFRLFYCFLRYKKTNSRDLISAELFGNLNGTMRFQSLLFIPALNGDSLLRRHFIIRVCSWLSGKNSLHGKREVQIVNSTDQSEDTDIIEPTSGAMDLYDTKFLQCDPIASNGFDGGPLYSIHHMPNKNNERLPKRVLSTMDVHKQRMKFLSKTQKNII